MKNNFIKLVVLFSSLSVTFFIADFILKSLYLPKKQSKVHLISKEGIFSDNENNIIKFASSKEYRHIGIYGGGIEFDYKFNTDENGFRKTISCNIEDRNIKKDNTYDVVITGDSLTQGTGSNFSWTESLEQKLCNKGFNSINTAIPGYSLEGMSNSLKYAKKEFNSKIAILAIMPKGISNEHYKVVKEPKRSYIISNLSKKRFVFWHIDNYLSNDEILSIADKKVKSGLLPMLLKVQDSLKFKTMKVKSKVDRYFKKVDSRNYSTNLNIENSIKHIYTSIKEYGKDNFLLIILPTNDLYKTDVDEFYTSKINNDLEYFLNSIQEEILIADLRRCQLSSSDFYELDGHPKEKGYRKISSCASKSKILNKFIENLK